MSSPRRIVLLATLVIVLIATALLADEAPAAATMVSRESFVAQLPEMGLGQFALEVRQQPLALDLGEAASSERMLRQTDGASLIRYLERADKNDGRVFGIFKSQQAGNPSLSVAGLQAGYGEIFSREYVSPHNRNGTEIEEPTTAYLKTCFSF